MLIIGFECILSLKNTGYNHYRSDKDERSNVKKG